MTKGWKVLPTVWLFTLNIVGLEQQFLDISLITLHLEKYVLCLFGKWLITYKKYNHTTKIRFGSTIRVIPLDSLSANLEYVYLKMIYITWNASIRKMFRLDQRSHRYFIEPISKIKHIKIAFMKRFIKFTEQLAYSTRRTTRFVFHTAKHDWGSILVTL